jgi:hypothetical protein
VPPQLGFSLGNPGAPDTIFVSSNTADNQLSLAMSSTVSATFAPGTLVAPADAGSGTGSLIYLDLSKLGLTGPEFDAIGLVADGWTATGYDGQIIGFTPTATVPLGPQPTQIAFALNGFTLAQASHSSATVPVLAYRIGGVTSGNFPTAGSVTVVFQLPDDNTGELSTAMQVAMTPTEVVNSITGCPQVENQLMLTMTQNPSAPVVAAGESTAFTLNFVYSNDPDGYGALLTIDESKTVEVSVGQGTTGWSITPNPNADPPFWTLVPPANTPLFGSGAQSAIAFDITNLVTTFQPGPTVALIGYSGVPGYKNGTFAVTLVKQPHATINSFAVSAQQVTLGEDKKARVDVSWSAGFFTQLTLIVNGQPNDVTDQPTGCSLSLPYSSTVQLLATGPMPGGGDNRAFSEAIQVQVYPWIKSFTLSEAVTNDGSTDLVITLAWDVVTNATAVDIVCGTASGSYPPTGSDSFSTQPPFKMALTASAGLEGPPVVQSIPALPSTCWAALSCEIPWTWFAVAVDFSLIQPTAMDFRIYVSGRLVFDVPLPVQRPDQSGSLVWSQNCDAGAIAMVTLCTTPYPPGGSARISIGPLG